MLNGKTRGLSFVFKNILWAGIVLAWISVPCAFASPLKFDEVLESVRTHYPLVEAVRYELNKSQADALSAKGSFDPVLKTQISRTPIGYYSNSVIDVSIQQPTQLWGMKVSGGWRTSDGKFPIYDGKNVTFTQGEVRAGVEIPLLRDGVTDERRTKIKLTEKGVDLAHQSVNAQILELSRVAAHRYWEWLAAGKKFKISEEMLSTAEVRDKALLSRVKHGDAPAIEHAENRRAVLQRQSALMAAERAQQKAAWELSLFYRDSKGQPVVPSVEQLPEGFPETTEPPHLEKSDSIDSALNRHPELNRLKLQLEQTEIDLRLSKNQLLPKLDFQIGYAQDLGQATAQSVPSIYPSELKVGVLFEVPLYMRTARGRIQGFEANYQRISAQRTLASDRIRTNIRDTSQAMDIARKRIAIARSELKLAKSLENAERVRFQHGDSSLLIINIREQNTGDAAIREIDALTEYFKSEVDQKTALVAKGIL